LIPVINKIDAGVLGYDKTGKFPGVGLAKNTRMSQWLKTPEGRQMFAAVNTLFSEELRQASGLAVTFTEEERARINNALQPSNRVEDFIQVYKELIRPRIRNITSSIVAGRPEQAINIYDKRNKRFKLNDFVNTDPVYLRAKKGGNNNDPLGIR